MLKLIALVVPEPLYSFVRKEQEFIANNWGPKHALRTPPHLTIIPPIDVTYDELKRIRKMAIAIAKETKPFEIEFNRFDAFPPRVIFINPVVNDALTILNQNWRDSLEKDIYHVLEKYPDRPYHPHLTLAHRDVDKTVFREMWNHFKDKEIIAQATFDRFYILKHHPGGWQIEEEFKFI